MMGGYLQVSSTNAGDTEAAVIPSLSFTCPALPQPSPPPLPLDLTFYLSAKSSPTLTFPGIALPGLVAFCFSHFHSFLRFAFVPFFLPTPKG